MENQEFRNGSVRHGQKLAGNQFRKQKQTHNTISPKISQRRDYNTEILK